MTDIDDFHLRSAKEALELLDAAIMATDALARHLENTGERLRFYETNKALHQLFSLREQWGKLK